MDLAKVVLAFAGFIVPPDPAATDFVGVGDPGQLARAEKAMQELRLWRWKVSILLFLSVAATSWLIMFSGYVRAEEVNQRVRVALGPIQQRLADVSEKMETLANNQTSLEKAINEQLAVSAADSICKLVARRAKETNIYELQSLRRDIDSLQAKYRYYMGISNDYPESRCEK